MKYILEFTNDANQRVILNINRYLEAVISHTNYKHSHNFSIKDKTLTLSKSRFIKKNLSMLRNDTGYNDILYFQKSIKINKAIYD